MKDKNLKVLISVEAKDKASAAIGRFNERFKSLTDLDKHFSSVGKNMRPTLRVLDKYSSKFKEMGKNMSIGITAPIAALSGLGFKVAADFEKEMLKAKVATKGEMFNELKHEALLQASKSKFSPSQAAEGIRWLGQGGMEAKDVKEALGPTLQLAAAADTDLGYTADTLGGILNTFGYGASKSQDTVDKLVTTFSGSAQTLNDLGESIKYSGFVGKGANQEFDSILMGLSILADSNIKGSEAGTGLSSVFESFINQEPKFIKAWKKLGLKQSDLIETKGEKKGQIKQLKDILITLKNSNAQAKDLFRMFGVQGGRAALALLGKSEEELVKKFNNIKTNFSGNAKKFADSRTEGFWGQYGILQSNLATLSEKVFGESGVLRKFTSLVKDLNEKLGQQNGNIKSETTKFYLKIGALTSVVAPTVFGIGVLTSIYNKYLKWMYGIEGVAAIFRFLLIRTVALTSIVGLIVVTIYQIYKHWDYLKTAFSDINYKDKKAIEEAEMNNATPVLSFELKELKEALKSNDNKTKSEKSNVNINITTSQGTEVKAKGDIDKVGFTLGLGSVLDARGVN